MSEQITDNEISVESGHDEIRGAGSSRGNRLTVKFEGDGTIQHFHVGETGNMFDYRGNLPELQNSTSYATFKLKKRHTIAPILSLLLPLLYYIFLPASCDAIVGIENGVVICENDSQNTSVGTVCKFSCNERYKLQGENGVVCESDGKWSRDLPTCDCDDCRIGKNCEKTTSWKVFRQDINQDGGKSHLDFAGHKITCDISHKGFYKWEWTYRCRCGDRNTGHEVECGNYESPHGACEHTSAEMIRQMIDKKKYPESCDKVTTVGC